jgi:hypothetical protein
MNESNVIKSGSFGGVPLRDYFAAAWLANNYAMTRASGETDYEATAKKAYLIADAMLKARL